MNPWNLLGLTQGATPEQIKKAFRKKALEAHPDKQGGDAELMSQLNGAYEMLSNPELLKKWEHSAEGFEDALNAEEKADPTAAHLMGDLISFSSVFKRRFAAFTEHLPVPNKISEAVNQKLFNDLQQQEKISDVESAIWQSEDGKQHASIHAYVQHQSAWAADPAPLSKNVFSDMTAPGAFLLLGRFLSGALYGQNLQSVQEYVALATLLLEAGRKPDAKMFRLVSDIMNPASLEEKGKMADLLSAVHEYAYTHDLENNGRYLRLIDGRYFRRITADAMWSFWENSEPLITRENLQNLASRHHLHLKVTPMVKTLWRFEKDFLKAFDLNADIETLYKAAWTQIDLMAACNSQASKANTALMAGMCLQYAAQRESDPRRSAAAERIALQLYQLTLETASYATPPVQLYIASNVVKCLREFRFMHVKLMTLTDSKGLKTPHQ